MSRRDCRRGRLSGSAKFDIIPLTTSSEAGTCQWPPSKYGGGKYDVFQRFTSQACASCTAARSRIRRALPPGVNGLPFSMPIVFSVSIIALSRVSHGSVCTMRFSESKYRAS